MKTSADISNAEFQNARSKERQRAKKEQKISDGKKLLQNFILFKNCPAIKKVLDATINSENHDVPLITLLYLEAHLTNKLLTIGMCAALLRKYGQKITYDACEHKFRVKPLEDFLVTETSIKRKKFVCNKLSPEMLKKFTEDNVEVSWIDLRGKSTKINFNSIINTLKNIEDPQGIFKKFFSPIQLPNIVLYPSVAAHYKKRIDKAKQRLQNFILFKNLEEIKTTLKASMASKDHPVALLILLYLEAHLIEKSVNIGMCYVILNEFNVQIISFPDVNNLLNEEPLKDIIETSNQKKRTLYQETINQLREKNTDGVTQIDYGPVINKLRDIEPSGVFAKFFSELERPTASQDAIKNQLQQLTLYNFCEDFKAAIDALEFPAFLTGYQVGFLEKNILFFLLMVESRLEKITLQENIYPQLEKLYFPNFDNTIPDDIAINFVTNSQIQLLFRVGNSIEAINLNSLVGLLINLWEKKHSANRSPQMLAPGPNAVVKNTEKMSAAERIRISNLLSEVQMPFEAPSFPIPSSSDQLPGDNQEPMDVQEEIYREPASNLNIPTHSPQILSSEQFYSNSKISVMDAQESENQRPDIFFTEQDLLQVNDLFQNNPQSKNFLLFYKLDEFKKNFEGINLIHPIGLDKIYIALLFIKAHFEIKPMNIQMCCESLTLYDDVLRNDEYISGMQRDLINEKIMEEYTAESQKLTIGFFKALINQQTEMLVWRDNMPQKISVQPFIHKFLESCPEIKILIDEVRAELNSPVMQTEHISKKYKRSCAETEGKKIVEIASEELNLLVLNNKLAEVREKFKEQPNVPSAAQDLTLIILLFIEGYIRKRGILSNMCNVLFSRSSCYGSQKTRSLVNQGILDDTGDTHYKQLNREFLVFLKQGFAKISLLALGTEIRVDLEPLINKLLDLDDDLKKLARTKEVGLGRYVISLPDLASSQRAKSTEKSEPETIEELHAEVERDEAELDSNTSSFLQNMTETFMSSQSSVETTSVDNEPFDPDKFFNVEYLKKF